MTDETLNVDSEIRFEPVSIEHVSLLYNPSGKSLVRHREENTPLQDFETRTQLECESEKEVQAFIIQFRSLPIGFVRFCNTSSCSEKEFELESIRENQEETSAFLDFHLDRSISDGALDSKILRFFLKTQVFKRYDSCVVCPKKENKKALKAYAGSGFSTVKDLDSTAVMIARKIEKRNPIVILGSSRSEGNTLKGVKTLLKDRPVPIVDLKNLTIDHYDYRYENKHDDFMMLAETMIRHNPIILATPVYWSTMSGLMKTFIDRWSDLIDIRKDIGRRLSHKELFVVASYGTTVPKGFEDAFSQTCDYLGIRYQGCLYFYGGENPEHIKNNDSLVEEFSDRIFSSNVHE